MTYKTAAEKREASDRILAALVSTKDLNTVDEPTDVVIESVLKFTSYVLIEQIFRLGMEQNLTFNRAQEILEEMNRAYSEQTLQGFILSRDRQIEEMNAADEAKGETKH